jgi:DNA-binding transcriptional ArsR family regulator
MPERRGLTTMEQTTFNISEVARLTGKARSTIGNHLRKGKLSCIYDDENNKLIEASEIIRVYSDSLELDEEGKLKSKTKRSESKVTGEPQEALHYKDLLEQEKLERQRERKQLEDTIGHLRDDLEKSQTRENRVTLLLENQTRDADRVADQMKEIKTHIAKQEERIRLHRKKLAEEKNKSLLQKIFG